MWPPVIAIDNLIQPRDLDQISEAIADARFVDGDVSTRGFNLQVKNNREMAADERYIRVVKIVERAVHENSDLNYTIFPRAITRPIISRYEVGMAYGEHVDSAVIGFMSQSAALGPFGRNYVRNDFAMTIFLADPDSYDGGELCLETPSGRQQYKLPAGTAAVYPPGLPHSVAPVSRGDRLAAVLWIHSMIHGHEKRKLVAELYRLAGCLAATREGSPEADLAMNIAANSLRLSADL